MNNQELKAKLIEQAKEILPKGFGISVRVGACSVFTVTIKSPYAFAHLDKLEPVNSWLQRNYLKQVTVSNLSQLAYRIRIRKRLCQQISR